MEEQKIDMFLMVNAKNFESEKIYHIKERMKQADESKWTLLQSLDFKNPTTILIVSILIGYLGIDRFMIGDTGLGIGKLLTCGGLGIWTIVDWFLIMGATKEKNLQRLYQFI